MNFVKDMRSNYRCVKFVNLSMSSLGVFSNECSTFLEMMNHIVIEKEQQHYIIIYIYIWKKKTNKLQVHPGMNL